MPRGLVYAVYSKVENAILEALIVANYILLVHESVNCCFGK
jgi:hypothetical protein